MPMSFRFSGITTIKTTTTTTQRRRRLTSIPILMLAHSGGDESERRDRGAACTGRRGRGVQRLGGGGGRDFQTASCPSCCCSCHRRRPSRRSRSITAATLFNGTGGADVGKDQLEVCLRRQSLPLPFPSLPAGPGGVILVILIEPLGLVSSGSSSSSRFLDLFLMPALQPGKGGLCNGSAGSRVCQHGFQYVDDHVASRGRGGGSTPNHCPFPAAANSPKSGWTRNGCQGVVD